MTRSPDPRSIDGTATHADPAYEVLPSGKTLLQERLTTYGFAVTLVAIAYFPSFYLTWRGHPLLRQQDLLHHIFSPWTFVLIGWHASVWLIGRGRPRPAVFLLGLDLTYSAGVGVVYARILLTHPSPVVAPLEGLLAIAAVLGMRALLVPSTGKRTAAAGALLCVTPGLTVFLNATHFSASWLGVGTTGPMFVTWAVVSIVLTSIASAVLYGLRRDVRDAQRLGQYTLVERLGEGGMGVVYRAKHALLRRPTAIKLLPPTTRPESIARFEREVQLMSELTHPNTVAVYDYGRTADGVFYYAMEYLDGVDLEELVAVSGPQPPGRVIHLLRQVCGSLDEAHRRGLIHRDVKPANLFLCKDRSEPDTIKVLDFGLVKHANSADPTLSAADAVLGTPLYISPEAITSPKALDARSDLYSLGAVAYLLVTGTPVFSAKTSMEVCSKHLFDAPEPMSARLGQPVPADLESIVLACLAKVPGERPADARTLRAELDRCESAGTWSAGDSDVWWNAYGARIESHRAGNQAPSGERTVLVNPWRAHELDRPA